MLCLPDYYFTLIILTHIYATEKQPPRRASG